MKTKLFILFVVVLGVRASGLEVGDTLQQTIDELGQPDGFVKLENSQILYYTRGRVELTDGNVTLAELVSAEEAAARLAREAEERVRRQEELRLLRERRYAKGKAVLEDRMADAAFQHAPSTKRIAYWETFKRSYPEVPLPEDYYTALRERDLEREEQRAAARLVELERRTQVAEQRANEAETRMIEAERRSSYPTYTTTYPRYIVPYTTHNVYNNRSRKQEVNHRDREQRTTVHRRIVNMPSAIHKPFESTAGYGFQHELRSPTVRKTTTTRQGPYRDRSGVHANVRINF